MLRNLHQKLVLVVPVKSTVEISKNFVAFSEYMNFKELVDWSHSNISKHHSDLLKSKRIQFIVRDGREGYAENGPYQAIHVGAAAKKTPQKLLDQLAPGGKLLIPVYSLSNPGTQTLEQIDKTEDGQIFRTKLMGVRFVPLTDKEVQWNED